MDPALREWIDRQEISALLVRHGASLDDRDWVRLRSCFTPDATGDYDPGAPNFEGYEAIEKLCRSMLEPLGASQHLIQPRDRARWRCSQEPLLRSRSTSSATVTVATSVVAWRDGNPRVLQPGRTRDGE